MNDQEKTPENENEKPAIEEGAGNVPDAADLQENSASKDDAEPEALPEELQDAKNTCPNCGYPL